MIKKGHEVLKVKGAVLRPFQLEDVDDTYCRWLNDPEVVRYLEARHADRSPEALRAFVKNSLANPNRHFFLVLEDDQDLPIGTASLVVRPHYNVATFGYMIGEREYWGGDYALVVQVALLDHAFGTLGLRRLEGGAAATNTSSHFNFRRLGFVREGTRRLQVIDNQKGPVDLLVYGMFAEEWQENSGKFNRFRVVTP